MWAAFQISLPVAISRTEPNDKPVASRRESKVPEPRQTSQFERPWDLFVPAKSVGKLTARMRVSKAISLVCAAKKAHRARSTDGALEPLRRPAMRLGQRPC